MRTIEDLFNAIKNPNNDKFVCESQETKYVIIKTGTTEILAQGIIKNREEPWKLPEGKDLSGFVNIHVRGIGIQPIKVERYFINPMKSNFLTLAFIEDRLYYKKK